MPCYHDKILDKNIFQQLTIKPIQQTVTHLLNDAYEIYSNI